MCFPLSIFFNCLINFNGVIIQLQGMHSDVATLRKASIWREASRIVGEEGFKAFWKGNLVTIAHRLPYSSVNFYAYEHYKKVCRNRMLHCSFLKFCLMPIKLSLISFEFYLAQLLQMIPGLESRSENMSTDLCVHFVGGGLAGITAASATYPLDLVRTRLAAQVRIMAENKNLCFRLRFSSVSSLWGGGGDWLPKEFGKLLYFCFYSLFLYLKI